MQLFSRRVHMTGPPAEVGAYAADITQHVSKISGRELALWSVAFGAPLGTMMFAMRVEGVADFEAISAKVLADADYHAKLAAGADWLTPGSSEDTLLQPLNAELGEASPPVGSVAQLTRAQMADGNFANALAWGSDIAAHATSVTGVPTMFLASMFGAFGSVAWIGVTADAAASDAANAALWADAEYMKKIDAAKGFFQPGTAEQMLAVRVA
jgi:hypothetical protein